MIKITNTLLNGWFNEFKGLFDIELTKPNYVVTTNRSRFGQFRPKTWTIEMSTAFVRSERDYKNTFIHEMCHLYVRQKYGRFVKSHGFEWQNVANKITLTTQGKYGTIQRVGGGLDKVSMRSAKTHKYVIFTDYNNVLSIAKYGDTAYIEKLKRLGGVKNNTTMYEVVSTNTSMERLPMRKSHCRSIKWNYLRGIGFALDDALKNSEIVKEYKHCTLSVKRS